MNRESKRMAQPQSHVDVDEPVALGRVDDLPRPTSTRTRTRTTPAQFLRDVRGEMRKVAWPSRSELVNYATVVFVTLVLIVGLIFGLNLAFAKGVNSLLQP